MGASAWVLMLRHALWYEAPRGSKMSKLMDGVGVRTAETIRRGRINLVPLGHKIRRIRLKRGLSMKKIGVSCGLSKGTLSDIEQGKTDPRYSTLKRLADCFGMTLSELMYDL